MDGKRMPTSKVYAVRLHTHRGLVQTPRLSAAVFYFLQKIKMKNKIIKTIMAIHKLFHLQKLSHKEAMERVCQLDVDASNISLSMQAAQYKEEILDLALQRKIV